VGGLAVGDPKHAASLGGLAEGLGRREQQRQGGEQGHSVRGEPEASTHGVLLTKRSRSVVVERGERGSVRPLCAAAVACQLASPVNRLRALVRRRVQWARHRHPEALCREPSSSLASRSSTCPSSTATAPSTAPSIPACPPPSSSVSTARCCSAAGSTSAWGASRP